MEITEELKRVIAYHYNLIHEQPKDGVIKPAPLRHDKVKMHSLEELMNIANMYFNGHFKEANKGCPGCIKRLFNLIKRKLDEWQIDRK